jgi:carbamate kinase
MSRLIVLALGGNSLIKDKAHTTVGDQYQACVETCQHIVALVERNYRLVITHGNGPQVGFILRRSDLSQHELHPVPMDSCVADTQGAIGYQIQMGLSNVLRRAGIERPVISLVTQTVVDASDPAFDNPSKPIGSFMTPPVALRRSRENGWQVVEDAGRGYRRVVPSPVPLEIVELAAVKSLADDGVIVVAAGGGGVPVVRDEHGDLRGVEAVIDKDLASSLLARQIEADLFVISTTVPKVYLNYRTPEQMAVDTMTVQAAEGYIAEGQFARGSMMPKIVACIGFVRATGHQAIVTNAENIAHALDGLSGTVICCGLHAGEEHE